MPLPPEAEQHRIMAEVERRLSLLRETEAQVDANLKRAERLASNPFYKWSVNVTLALVTLLGSG